MDDNKNLNQTNTDTQNTDDYQKILDEYAASIKPEDDSSDIAEKSEENIKLEDVETEPADPNEEQLHLKDLNSLQLEAPDNKSIPAATPKTEAPAMTQPLNIEPPISEPTPKVTEPQPAATLPPEPATAETKTPEEIKAQIDKILADDSSSTTNISSISSSNSKSGAKKLFFFSVVIFMLVAAGWIYLLYFYQQPDTKNTNNTAISPTPTEVVKEETCELNDVTYKVGESFKSADGCNTCSCQTGNMIACTEMACSLTPTTSATKSATKTPTKVTLTPTKSATSSNLKTYENKEIGFSFKYPTTLGEFTFTTSKGDTGSEFSGKFSKSNNTNFIGLAGVSTNFSLGRGGSLFGIFSGYSNKNNQIYDFSVGDRVTNNNNLIDSKAIKKIYKNKNGVEIVLLTGYTLDQEDEMTLLLPCGIGEGNIGALINTNSKTYPGVAFKFPKTLESDLMIILDSLEIN